MCGCLRKTEYSFCPQSPPFLICVHIENGLLHLCTLPVYNTGNTCIYSGNQYGNFLESTIHLRPSKSLLPIASTHYNRRTSLSRTERIYPHRGGCTSVRSQRTLVTNYARNLYHNTDSPRVFIERLVASHRRHPEYSLRGVSTSALKVLNNTTRNRFLLSPRHLLHLAKCIQHGRTQYTPSLAYTHFLKPYK